MLKLRRGDLPVCIVRPAIINTSYAEPFPGWLDSIAAAAAYFMFIGLGIVKEAYAQIDKVGDMVPVDVVVANIIVATAYNARAKKINIYHVGSSDRNPMPWGTTAKIVTDFWNTNVSQSRVSKAKLMVSQHESVVKMH